MEIVQGYSGVWEVLTPFTIEPTIYTCTGISTISALEDAGVNIFSRIYDPKNLSRETYDVDKKKDVKIITLKSEQYPTLLIPEYYVEKVPRYKVAPYSRLIIGIDAGICHDNLDIDTLKAELGDKASSSLGLNVEVYARRVPIKKVIDESTHKKLEKIRQTNIQFDKSTNAQLKVAESKIDDLTLHVRYLEEIIESLS